MPSLCITEEIGFNSELSYNLRSEPLTAPVRGVDALCTAESYYGRFSVIHVFLILGSCIH